MSSPIELSVTPRDVHFDAECARGGAWLGGNPVATAVFNALSLTFPDGERLFIDSVRAFRSRLHGKLAEDAQAFIAQEAIHSREHASLNAQLDRSHYPVDRIEASVRWRLGFLRKLGPMRMLGVTIALEHFTAMLADMFDSDPDLWVGTPEELLRLWRWHAMEETEHKAVAFDVFREVSRDWTPVRRYLFRAQIMVLTSVHFTFDVIWFAASLLSADGMGRWRARWQVVRFLFGRPGLFRKLGPRYRAWYRPGFHPWDHDNRQKLEQWRLEFRSSSCVESS
jgi:predicted metal-dependent hydrolase